MKLPWLFLLALTLTASALAQPLDPLLTAPNLWTMTPAEFMAAGERLGFAWTSNQKDSARAAGHELTLYGVPAVESIARFEDGKPKAITVIFYARGDSGDWAEEKFDALVKSSAEAITKAAKAQFTVRGKDPTSAVKAEGLIWQAPAARYLLEYSKTKEVKVRNIPFRAEFVRLEITSPEKKLGLLASATNLQRAKFSGPLHVKRDPATGDVWLADVPMVDQGEKGYCVVASAERVMRYYGNQVDQQELAQIANTSSQGGTSSEAMLDALKKVSARLKVRVREVEKFDVKEIVKLMADYNRAAKHDGVAAIPDQGRMLDVGAIYNAMDFNVLREVRTKNKSDLTRFEHAAQAHIDQGIPLLWTVMLGKAPEPGIPQNAGGHMRLIIGYNEKKEEILFSDSWGAGHELKRMPSADAWAITTGTMTIEPL